MEQPKKLRIQYFKGYAVLFLLNEQRYRRFDDSYRATNRIHDPSFFFIFVMVLKKEKKNLFSIFIPVGMKNPWADLGYFDRRGL